MDGLYSVMWLNSVWVTVSVPALCVALASNAPVCVWLLGHNGHVEWDRRESLSLNGATKLTQSGGATGDPSGSNKVFLACLGT